MTYLEICQAVRAQAGIAGSGPSNVTGQTGIEADIVRWVDEAYNEIQSLYENWNFMWVQESFTLPAGIAVYPVMSTFNLRKVSDDVITAKVGTNSFTRMRNIPWAYWKNSNKYLSTAVGITSYLTEDPSGTYRFSPIPSESTEISIEGFTVPDVMSVSTDVPVFPTQYHDTIKTLALLKYSEYYNAPEIYKTAKLTYDTLLDKMKYSELPRNNLVTPNLVPFA